MKTILMALALLGASLTAVQAQDHASKKMLVLYFSVPESSGVDASTGASRIVADGKAYGTTEYVATTIAQLTGADKVQLKTAQAYPSSTHKALIEYAKRESEAKTYPLLATQIPDFADYDVVFVGYPNWWYDMPRAIYSLLKAYDFSGKTLIPFCTHGGSGFSQSVTTIGELEPGAKVIALPAIARNSAAQSGSSVESWLRKQGFIR